MLKGTRNLILDTIIDCPSLLKSNYTKRDKWKIFSTYIRISIKLFTIHRIHKITREKILGFTISFFDYGTLHFLFREIFIRNAYYFDSKKKSPHIFDVGANIGVATIFFKWLYPESIIDAFEPDPQTYALLRKNIEQNDLKNVHLRNVAILDKKGNVNFYIDTENPGWLTMSIIRERLPKDKIVVQAFPLSHFIKHTIDFLKVDIEGAETVVVQEVIQSKKISKIKEMIIEYHHGISKNKQAFSQFLNLFEKNGFTFRIEARSFPKYQQSSFQDICVYLYRNNIK